jgi:hypothetical protein
VEVKPQLHLHPEMAQQRKSKNLRYDILLTVSEQ